MYGLGVLLWLLLRPLLAFLSSSILAHSPPCLPLLSQPAGAVLDVEALPSLPTAPPFLLLTPAGAVLDVEALVATVRAHAPNARLVVDGVALAPHRQARSRAYLAPAL